MAQITSSIGLISGLNTSQIISELVSIDAQPVTLLQQQIDTVSEQTTAFNDLATSLQTIQSAGTALKSPLTFQNATTTSSNPGVLTATASPGASIGSYQFSVARLVTTQQLVSEGFASPTTGSLDAGNITIDLGGGQLSAENKLSDLNGGAGASLGEFKITDRSGATATIDTSNAVTLQDVVTDINTATGINVKASVDGNHIVLTDETGKTTSDLIVQDVDDDDAATSLGIAGDSATGGVLGTLTGTAINYLGNSTSVGDLNDGNGIQLGTGGADLSIDPGDGGGAIQVSLSGANTVGAVIKAINAAGGSRLTAAASGNGITLTSVSGGSVSVTDLNGSKAAEGLGLTNGSQTGGTLAGSSILADLGTTLVSQLNGGSGLSLGTITVQSSGSSSPTSVDLSGAKTVQQIIDDINNAGAGVSATLNNAGDGIQIADTANGTGSLVIGGASATTLGLAGTFAAGSVATGSNLHHQYISAGTTLANYNGGAGVSAGKFTITSSKGASATIDTTNDTTLGDVINQINEAKVGVTASINANGNGLLLTDTAGGGAKLSVIDDQGSTAATDLNIAGTATGTTIDGALEKTIAVTSSDTLTTLEQKINTANFGVTAQIVNDGSSSNGYRLSISAINSGTAGQVTVDDGSTNLNTSTLIQAQDAAVFFGDNGGSSKPILITSSKNTLNNVINGVSLTLNGVSQAPVTLNVTGDSTNITSQLTTLVSNFNQTILGISTLTSFNTTTDQPGLLLGDATVQGIQSKLYDAINTVVKGAGNYSTLADIGLTISDQGELSFDEDTFNAAYSDDPTDVSKLFTDAASGFGTKLESDVTDLIDPVTGSITQETNTLATKNQNNATRLTELNAIVDATRSRLQLQFANLETVLAGLQSQQSALGSISGISDSTSSSSSKSS